MRRVIKTERKTERMREREGCDVKRYLVKGAHVA